MPFGHLARWAHRSVRCFGTKPVFIPDLGGRIASSFSKDATATAQQIVQSLQPAERTFLLEALKADTMALAQTAQNTARFLCPHIYRHIDTEHIVIWRLLTCKGLNKANSHVPTLAYTKLSRPHRFDSVRLYNVNVSAQIASVQCRSSSICCAIFCGTLYRSPIHSIRFQRQCHHGKLSILTYLHPPAVITCPDLAI